ncbi:hypothetical protein EON81_26700, partial [bacterium]
DKVYMTDQIVQRDFYLNFRNRPEFFAGGIEDLTVTLTFSHARRGDLRVFLSGPGVSQLDLMRSRADDEQPVNNFSWKINTSAFLLSGAGPGRVVGPFQLQIEDVQPDPEGRGRSAGIWHSFRVTARSGALIYAYDNSQFVSETSQAFAPGERKAVRMSFKNTGTTSWTAADTVLAADAATASAWSITQTPLRTETPPGSTADFVFYATAPTASGTYPWVWKVRKGASGIGQSNSGTTKVVAGYGSDFVSQTGLKRTVAPGERFTAYLTFKNTGSLTWQKSDGVCLKSQWPLLNSTWGVSKIYFNTEVAPGATFAIRVGATAPITPGSYSFKWQLGTGGNTVFGDANNTFTVNVAP